jgi:hypothetical protein
LDLTDCDQAGRALRKLVSEDKLIKVGFGLYAKSKRSSLNGKIIPVKPLPQLAREGLEKLGVTVVGVNGVDDYNAGNPAQVPTGRVIMVKGRVNRKIGYEGKFATIQQVA